MRRLAWVFLCWLVLCPSRARSEERGFDKLEPKLRERCQRILDDPTLARPAGERTVKTTIPVYELLLERLDLTGRLVHHLKVGRYSIERRPENRFLVDDRAGAVALVQEVASFPRHGLQYRVYLAEGHFALPARQKIEGEALILLGYKMKEDGLYSIADIFFRARNGAMHELARRLQTITGRVLRQKATLFIQAAQEVSQSAQEDPQRIARLLRDDRAVEAADSEKFGRDLVARANGKAPRPGE